VGFLRPGLFLFLVGLFLDMKTFHPTNCQSRCRITKFPADLSSVGLFPPSMARGDCFVERSAAAGRDRTPCVSDFGNCLSRTDLRAILRLGGGGSTIAPSTTAIESKDFSEGSHFPTGQCSAGDSPPRLNSCLRRHFQLPLLG
jgi:hypothetical protein